MTVSCADCGQVMENCINLHQVIKTLIILCQVIEGLVHAIESGSADNKYTIAVLDGTR